MPALSLCRAALAWILISTAVAAAEPLALDEVLQLALRAQPLLDAQSARAQAAHARATSAGALPDPQLVGGFDNVSLERPDPYADDVDGMTMTTLGLMQEFPNAAKRRERSRRERSMAAAADAALEAARLAVARDATLAWLDVWQAQQALQLVDALAAETRRQREAAGIAYRSAGSGQSAVHAATVAQGLIEDRQRALAQSLAAARARLARWIGAAAERRPQAQPTAPAQLPPLDAALAAVDDHPELRMNRRSADAAEADVALARAAYRPDWRVQAMYGYRKPYDDMVSLQLGIDLPLFTAQRQDRELEAARAEHAAAAAEIEMRRRELRAAIESAWREASALRARLDDYAGTLLPAADARIDAALAAYRSGRGTLDEVLAARMAALDLRLMQLDLETELQRRHAELRYWLPAGSASRPTETTP